MKVIVKVNDKVDKKKEKKEKKRGRGRKKKTKGGKVERGR